MNAARVRCLSSERSYFFGLDFGFDFGFGFVSRWASALPAADLALALDLGFRRTFEAALAAGLEVSLAGALVWASALPAAFFEALEPRPERVFDALDDARFPVVFFPMVSSRSLAQRVQTSEPVLGSWGQSLRPV